MAFQNLRLADSIVIEESISRRDFQRSTAVLLGRLESAGSAVNDPPNEKIDGSSLSIAPLEWITGFPAQSPDAVRVRYHDLRPVIRDRSADSVLRLGSEVVVFMTRPAPELDWVASGVIMLGEADRADIVNALHSLRDIVLSPNHRQGSEADRDFQRHDRQSIVEWFEECGLESGLRPYVALDLAGWDWDYHWLSRVGVREAYSSRLATVGDLIDQAKLKKIIQSILNSCRWRNAEVALLLLGARRGLIQPSHITGWLQRDNSALDLEAVDALLELLSVIAPSGSVETAVNLAVQAERDVKLGIGGAYESWEVRARKAVQVGLGQ